MTAREVQIWFQNRRAKQKNMLMRACSSNASPELCADKDASAEASCVQSPVDDVLSASSKLTRACSADHSQQHAASTRPPLASALCSSSSSLGSSVREMMAPTLALRRHSDIPAHFFHSETSAYAAAVAATASAGAMLPAVSTVNRSATIPSSIAATAASSECAASLQMSTAAYPSQIPPPLTNVSSSDMLQRAAYSHVPSSRPIQLVPSQQQKKQKRAGNGDSDRYHTARVHQEAFDGTNKLPVKYDDFLKRTADEQFNLLDPANLPNFMIPTVPGNGLGALGSGMSSVGFSSQPPMPYGGMGWPAMPYSGCGNSQSHPSMHSAMPQPDMSMLFSGLLALSPNGGGGSGHSYPSMLNAPFGLSGMGSGLGTGTAAPAAHPGMSPADMPFGVDSSSSFYHTLLLLAHQNPNLAGNSSAQRQGIQGFAFESL
ncbi:hypothetical protein LPJ66_006904 [Kickxella alabastrina]|uniref:Uncharacterized protein n=1 Tax=Kickxella alabastrina TaxID=61397 RepID=A0ACC1IIP0_9FUNG|nr:hypothetical protein LPJ66_006904 [Kickxella alabastrina]